MMYITKISSGWFEGCVNLSQLNYDPGLILRVYASAFNYCTSLKEFAFDLNTVEMLYTSFEGWTADQTIKLIGNGRDFAALEEDADWYNNCDAKIILVDEQQ